jgi:lipoyl-dependent peroxiredoxin
VAATAAPSCFGQAVLLLAKKHGLDGRAAKVTCGITIDKDATSFALQADIKLSLPGVDKDKLEALLKDAHEICPYSKATRGNIPVTLSVG